MCVRLCVNMEPALQINSDCMCVGVCVFWEGASTFRCGNERCLCDVYHKFTSVIGFLGSDADPCLSCYSWKEEEIRNNR